MRSTAKLSTALGLAAALVLSPFIKEAKAEYVETSRRTFSFPAVRRGEKDVEVLIVQTGRDDEKKELYAKFTSMGDIHDRDVSLILPDYAACTGTKLIITKKNLTNRGVKDENTEIAPHTTSEDKDSFRKRLDDLIGGIAIGAMNPASMAPSKIQNTMDLFPIFDWFGDFGQNAKNADFSNVGDRARLKGKYLVLVDAYHPLGIGTDLRTVNVLRYTFSIKESPRDVQVQLPNGRIITGKYPPANTPLEAFILYRIGASNEGVAQTISNMSSFQGRVETSSPISAVKEEYTVKWDVDNAPVEEGKTSFQEIKIHSQIDTLENRIKIEISREGRVELQKTGVYLIVPQDFGVKSGDYNCYPRNDQRREEKVNGSDRYLNAWFEEALYAHAFSLRQERLKELEGINLGGKENLEGALRAKGRKIIAVHSAAPVNSPLGNVNAGNPVELEFRYDSRLIPQQGITALVYIESTENQTARYSAVVPCLKSKK